jgi:hypothetical protein
MAPVESEASGNGDAAAADVAVGLLLLPVMLGSMTGVLSELVVSVLF